MKAIETPKEETKDNSSPQSEQVKTDQKVEEKPKKVNKFAGQKPTEMQYYVKFKHLSYRKVRWINESDFDKVYSFQC